VDNAMLWRWDNGDPFGANAADENPTGQGWFAYGLRFPGQYYDAETGRHYNYFRDYDPAVARYEQSDPIGLKGGLSTYGYGDGAPLGKKDAHGLATYMCRKPLHACGNTGNERCFADIPGNPFYHQYLCVIEPNGNVTCGGQDRAGNPFSSAGKPSEDYYPFNRPDMCRNEDPRECVDKCVQRRVRSPERPRYGIPFGTDCQEWSDDVLLQCRNECKNQ
jgi:RHS repeat-associated protein